MPYVYLFYLMYVHLHIDLRSVCLLSFLSPLRQLTLAREVQNESSIAGKGLGYIPKAPLLLPASLIAKIRATLYDYYK